MASDPDTDKSSPSAAGNSLTAGGETSLLPADDLRGVDMSVIWGAVFFVVAVVGGLLTPWDALLDLLENQGVSDEGVGLLAFLAAFTFPLTVGTAVIAYAVLRGVHRGMSAPGAAFAVAVTLVVTGWLCGQLGLGLAPDFSSAELGGGAYAPLMWAVSAYLSSYGWTLMVCAIAIGCGLAIQIERWQHEEAEPSAS